MLARAIDIRIHQANFGATGFQCQGQVGGNGVFTHPPLPLTTAMMFLTPLRIVFRVLAVTAGIAGEVDGYIGLFC